MTEVGLDELDKRFIYELDQDSRQPLSKLAKRMHISTQRLDYRLRMLEKNGVIIGYPTVVNLSKIGSYRHYTCCIRAYRTTSREQDEHLKTVAKDPECTLAYSCEGAWDEIIGTVAKDLFSAKNTFSRLLEPIKHRIRKKIIYTNMRVYNYGRRYMLESWQGSDGKNGTAVGIDRKHRYMVTGDTDTPADYGELDIQILRIISANARLPSVDIAKLAGTTPETAVAHLRSMEKSGIIEGYATLLAPKEYNYQFNRVTVELASIDEATLHEITEYMKRFPNMFRLIELFEIDGFMLDFVSRTFDETEHILSEFRDRYRESIDDMEITRMTCIYKATYFPTFSKTTEKRR